jgi:hypothetical protein
MGQKGVLLSKLGVPDSQFRFQASIIETSSSSILLIVSSSLPAYRPAVAKGQSTVQFQIGKSISIQGSMLRPDFGTQKYLIVCHFVLLQ